LITAAAYIDKVSSDRDGGYCIKLIIAQSNTEAVKALLDCIGNTVFQVQFDKVSDMSQEKRAPGRPKREADE
jgi:hypothetical protein